MKTIVTGGAGFLGSHLCDLLLEKGHHNVDTRIVRIFNTYGPRMRARDDRVVPNFINHAQRMCTRTQAPAQEGGRCRKEAGWNNFNFIINHR